MAKDFKKERAEAAKVAKEVAELAASLGKTGAKLKQAVDAAEKTKKEWSGEEDE